MLHRLGTRRVRIDGLASKPEYNGRTGTAEHFFEDRMRYAVCLDDAAADTKPLAVGVDKVQRILTDEEIAAIPATQPNAELFALYSNSFPVAKNDGAFQARHLHLNAFNFPNRTVLVRSFPMQPCGGCPECLFGTSEIELHTAQKEHPAIKAWQKMIADFQHAPTNYPMLAPADAPPLRYAVGDEVLCKTGNGPMDLSAGRIIKLYYGLEGEEDRWPGGCWAPYQIRLTTRSTAGLVEEIDELIFAPADIDAVVRAMPVWRHGGLFCCAACAMESSGSVIE